MGGKSELSAATVDPEANPRRPMQETHAPSLESRVGQSRFLLIINHRTKVRRPIQDQRPNLATKPS
jgi:hypothetical protein